MKTQLTWKKCNCGSPHCKLEYPQEIGSFYQGTGFSPEEKELMTKAFDALKQLPKVEEALRRANLLILNMYEHEGFSKSTDALAQEYEEGINNIGDWTK